MALSDILVIYISCGAPFAIHVMMTNADRPPLATALRTAFNFAVWPAIAIGVLFRIANGSGLMTAPAYETSVNDKLKIALSDFESLSHVGYGPGTVFEFRDAFARYTNLAMAFFDTKGLIPTAEVFEIAEHPDPTIASICLSRRTRHRLLVHLNHARSEFVDLVLDMSIRCENIDLVSRLSIAVAEAVEDGEGLRQFKAIFAPAAGMPVQNLPSGDGEQIWSTEHVSPVVS